LTNIIVQGVSNYTTNLAAGTLTFTLTDGQHATLIYQNQEQNPPTGSVSLTKLTCPTDTQTTFTYLTNTTTPGTFTLTSGATWNSGNLAPGTYFITERVPTGWNLTNILITGTTNYTTNLTTGTLTFTLEANQHISLIYQNEELPPLPGTIAVTKVSCPLGAAADFTFVTSALPGTFTLTDGATWYSGNLAPGTYFVTELAQAGWKLVNILIDDPSGNATQTDLSTGTVFITLQAGSHVTLIYQNTQQHQPPCHDCCKKPCECRPCCDCSQKPCQCKPCCDCNQKPCQCKPNNNNNCNKHPNCNESKPPCNSKPNCNPPKNPPCTNITKKPNHEINNSHNDKPQTENNNPNTTQPTPENNTDNPQTPTHNPQNTPPPTTQTTNPAPTTNPASNTPTTSPTPSKAPGPNSSSSNLPTQSPQPTSTQATSENPVMFGLNWPGAALAILLGAIVTLLTITAIHLMHKKRKGVT
ncbi:MAG: hypothetical protein LBI79_07975, partial [Nitrososphaerota archaeon]|nr:hypothetical protein [Nitrososphaerota archaeon]